MNFFFTLYRVQIAIPSGIILDIRFPDGILYRIASVPGNMRNKSRAYRRRTAIAAFLGRERNKGGIVGDPSRRRTRCRFSAAFQFSF